MLIYNYHAVFTARDIVMEPSYDGAPALCSPVHICMSELRGLVADERMHCPKQPPLGLSQVNIHC